MKLKKLFAGLISLAAALLAVCAITVCAGAEWSGNYQYSVLSDGTVEITDYDGSAADLTIPSTLNGKKVAGIGRAFDYCDSIISVTIPSSVRYIHTYAFYSCSNLISIIVDKNNENYSSRDGVLFNKDMTRLLKCPEGKKGNCIIPDGVKNIEYEAFRACSYLTSVDFSDSVASISEGEFLYCSSLTSINVDQNNQIYSSKDGVLYNKDLTKIIKYPQGKKGEYIIPDTVKSIGYETFRDCSNLTSVVIPNSFTSIGSHAFYECSNLASINIPDTVTYIGVAAFYNCSSLPTITIPDSVTNIDESAFLGCSSLTSINLPDNITSLNNHVFYGCNNLVSVAIPDSVTNIGSSAFSGCEKITSINIPDGVTSIGDSAFYQCSSLSSITIPESVKSIGKQAFGNCSNLTSITIDENNMYYSSQDGVMFNKDKTELMLYPAGKKGKYTIPNSVTSIIDGAFGFCDNLTSITIPDSVTSMEEWPFHSCASLTSIKVDENNNYYSSENGVLFNKDKTELISCPPAKAGNFVIPDSVTTIKRESFLDCTKITSVTIPTSVTTIDFWAFQFSGLTDVYYTGFRSQWGDIYIHRENSTLRNANMHYGTHTKTTRQDNVIKATCSQSGSYNEVTYCSDCGEVFNCETIVIPPTGNHIWDEWGLVEEWATCGKDGYGYYRCLVCDAKQIYYIPATGNHTFSSWKTTKAATCATAGTQTRTCSVCDKTETQSIPATGKHTYVDKVVAPTYTTEGYTEHTCSVCGNSYRDNYTDKLKNVEHFGLKARGADAIQLKWAKSADTDGYVVEQQSGNTWKTVKEINSAATTNCRISGLKGSTKYTWRIKAYKNSNGEKLYGEAVTASYTTNPTVVAGFKLTKRADSALTFSWNKNSTANGYIIEKKVGGEWVRVKKITNPATTSYTVTGLKSGTVYDIRIKSYYMAGKTALYSKTKTVSARTNPSAVAGLKLKASAKDAVRLSWTKNTSADGYIVEMKVGGVWKRAGKITSNSTVEFKKSGLKSKTSYTFRIKAYKMSGKTALYSGYTTITVKTK